MSKKKIFIIGSLLVAALSLLIAARVGLLTDLTKLKGDMSWSEYDSMFLTGPEVNAKMKKLAGATGNVSYTAENTNITSIRRANQITDDHKTDSNKVSMQFGKPIYMWFDNGTIYYYTEAETVFFHADSERFFYRLKGLTSLDISSIKTHQVTNMIEMFASCDSLESFNVSASNFNTERVTTMASMFSGDSKLTNLDLNYFNTSNVEDMSGMFNGCSSLVQLHIEAFNTSKVTDMTGMFSHCEKLERIDLSNFNTSKVEDMTGMFYDCNSLKNLNLSNFNTSKVTQMIYMFVRCYGLTNLDLRSFSSESLDDASGMFWASTNLKSIDFGSNFTLSNATDISTMFEHCTSLESLDLRYFNPFRATDLHGMFGYCEKLERIDFGNFNTSLAEDMSGMFTCCKSLKYLDVSSFNTSNVTNMNKMFYYCQSLPSVIVSNFNTSRVTNMSSMFLGCSQMKVINLSNFDTRSVTDFSGMFNMCSNLTTIYVSNLFDVSNMTSSEYIFNSDYNLVGGNGTTFSSDHDNKEYARIDSANTPGYFTLYSNQDLITITFNAGEGTVSESTRTLEKWFALGPFPNITAPANKTFVGWYISPEYGLENKVSISSVFGEDTTIYARYVDESELVTVTFNPTEGTFRDQSKVTQSVPYGSTVTLPNAGDLINQYSEFIGWYTSTDYIEEVSSETPILDDITYYARWQRYVRTVTFDPGEGILSEEKRTKQVNAGSTVGNLPVPTREYFTFEGWYKDRQYTERVVTSTVVETDVTYYAKWAMENPLCKRAKTSELHKNGTITYGQAGTADTLSVGDAFICDVNGDGTYNATNEMFYYVSDYFDPNSKTTDTSYATLIYSKNYSEQIRYLSDLTTSPSIEYLTGLPTTSEWSNITLKNSSRIVYDYKLVGRLYAAYQGNVSYDGKAARLVTYEELKGCFNNAGVPATIKSTCSFLMEGAKSDYPVWLETININASDNKSGLVITTNQKVETRGLNLIGAIKPTIDVNKVVMDLSTQDSYYTITFDAQDGTFVDSSQATMSVIEGGLVTLPEVTREGYNFDGWYTSLDYTQRVYNNLPALSNATYYAKWVEKDPICRAARSSQLHKSGNITYGQVPIEGEYHLGDAYICDVDGDGYYHDANEMFYYVSDYFDTDSKTTDTSYASLIYSRVYHENIRYLSDLTSSPDIEFLNGLPTTSDWSNVSLKDTTRTVYDYQLNGRLSVAYQGVVSYEGKAARLITYEELKDCIAGSGVPASIGNTCLFLTEETDTRYPVFLETINVNESENHSGLVLDLETYNIHTRSLNYVGAIKPTIDIPKSQMGPASGTDPVINYTITFDPGEGELATSERTREVTAGSAIGILPIPVRGEDYTFDGWYTTTTYETQVLASTVVNSSATYYAKWTPVGGGGEQSDEITIVDVDHVTKDGDNILIKVPTGTKLERQQLLDMITIPGEYTLKDKNNNEITAINQGVGTGSTLSFSGTTYTLTVYGDVNGDGRLDGQDIVIIYSEHMKARDVSGQSRLTELQTTAANINHDSYIDLMDIMAIHQRMKDSDESGN